MARRLTGALLGSGAITVALVAVGTGPLGTPPLLRPGATGPWEARVGALDATFALLRVGALAAGGYVDVVLLLALLAALAGASRGRRLALRLAPPPLRVLLVVAVGVSAAPATAWASPAGAAPTPGSAGAAPLAPVLAPADALPAEAPAPDLGEPRRRPGEAPLPVLYPARTAPASSRRPARRVEPRPTTASPSAPARPRATLPRRATSAATAAARASRSPRPATWTVAPGESFWSIAADVVAGRLGRPAADREVARYWIALLAANAGRLPVPGEPDLLFAGDVVVLPAAP